MYSLSHERNVLRWCPFFTHGRSSDCMGRINEKQNCWEYMKCGREPNGSRVEQLGVCPAATADTYHGINSGQNGGRFCWKVIGTRCFETINKHTPRKLISCIQCAFFKKVKSEEKISYSKISSRNSPSSYRNWWKGWMN